jgi:hypothetical protein
MRNSLIILALTTTLIVSTNAQAAEEVKHIPGVFLGATHVDSDTEFTFGFEYEYKLDGNWGVGAIYERSNGAHHNDGVAVVLASIYYHPTKNIRLGAGIGQERIGGGHPHKEDLYRVSAAYDFHMQGFGIAPTIAVDFVDDEEAIVFGIAITKPF